MAKSQLKNDKRITFRISNNVLTGLQKKAFDGGVAYQPFMSGVLPKFLLEN